MRLVRWAAGARRGTPGGVRPAALSARTPRSGATPLLLLCWMHWRRAVQTQGRCHHIVTLGLLANCGAHAAFIAGLKISPADRALAASVIAFSSAKAQGAGSDKQGAQGSGENIPEAP